MIQLVALHFHILLVANRVLTVGDPRRALEIAHFLDKSFKNRDANDSVAVSNGECSCLSINGATNYAVDQDTANDFSPSVTVIHSSRGFTTYTGTYKGVPISIISIGMGFPMMDMMIREVRSITTGPMAIIRLVFLDETFPKYIPTICTKLHLTAYALEIIECCKIYFYRCDLNPLDLVHVDL
jgi:hypothetical protein